ncbi:hypothetical protein OQA88_13279 [Cercophora sp. LCS_1]
MNSTEDTSNAADQTTTTRKRASSRSREPESSATAEARVGALQDALKASTASSPKEPPRPNMILVKITCSVAWICAVPNPHKYVPKPIPDRIKVKVEVEEEDDECFSADLQRNINKVADCRRGETTVKNPPSWLRREWIAEVKQKQEKKEEKLAEYGINKEDLPVETAPNKFGSPQARITDPDTIDGLFEDDQTMQSPPIRASNYMDGGNGEEEEEQDGSPPTSEAGNEEDDEFEGACRQTTANSIW